MVFLVPAKVKLLSGGLGKSDRADSTNTPATFAAIGFLATLGIASFLLVVFVEYVLTPWRSSSKARRWSPGYWRTDGAQIRGPLHKAATTQL